LELDIGFLLGVCFLIPSAAGANIGTAPCGADSVGVPVIANAGPRPLQHLVRPHWPVMAFGMPEMRLSRQAQGWKCRKHWQLDMVVFGMPKIVSDFFC
jgi:hypothetical protein